MPLALPTPQRPAAAASRAQTRAFVRWQSGQQLAEGEQWPAAALAFEQASELHREPAYGLAAVHALIKAARAPAAAQRALAIIAQHPNSALAYTLAAHALLETGQHAEAARVLRGMPAGLARDHAHLLALGTALQRCQQHQDAIAVFFQALALRMDDAYLHFHLGTSFKELGMKAEAAECVRTAVVLGVSSSDLAARGQLLFLEREACRWPQARAEEAALRERLRSVPVGQAMETSAFTHAVLIDDPAEVMKVAQHHALHVARQVKPLPRRNARSHDGRLRLGYLSADFHTHATSQLMAQMLESHDRTTFEVSLFSTGPDDGSPMRRRMEQACEHFEHLRGQPHETMARRIREAGIDVLVDLKGITYDNPLHVLAHRPAPVQLSWLGFPGSTGAPFIDYFVGDAIVTPLQDATDFSEKIAQLPGCYQPNDNRRERPAAASRSEIGVADDALLLCGFHQPYKISPQVFDAWCELLHELPHAVLWLLHWNSNVQAALEREAGLRGIGPERLLFAPVVKLERHLRRLACADLYLDAWPCNAHTTASEALWMGVPVVSLKGRTFASRVGASLLHAAGLDELACTSPAQYRNTVVELANDAPRRARLHAQLEEQRLTSALFNGELFARRFEALVQRIWQRACAGLPAQHLEAEVQ